MNAHIRSRSKLVAAAICAVVAGACSQAVSVGTEAPAPTNSLRPVELTHDKCDIDSKDAVRTDVNNDGNADITRVMSGGREVCRAINLNFAGPPDNFVYFDDRGQLRRRESDFDRDGITDEIAIFQNGKLVRKDRETNLDRKIDTWDFYVSDVLTRRERDTNADGRVDQWWSWPDGSKPDCPLVESDTDADGRPDARQDVCKEREAAQQAGVLAASPAPAAASAPTAVPSTRGSASAAPAPAAADAGTGRDSGGGR
jgi:hypothetical protein